MKSLIIFILSLSTAFASPHAKELMGGKTFKKYAGKKIDVDDYILKTLKSRLPKTYKTQAPYIKQTIIANAKKHNLDPIFILAMICGESSFNPQATGPVGEVGMLQLRPHVAKWVYTDILKKKWTSDKILPNPHENIRIGVAYVGWLRKKFPYSAHYIAAYNLGPGQLKSALKRKILPKDYPQHVMKRYLSFYDSM